MHWFRDRSAEVRRHRRDQSLRGGFREFERLEPRWTPAVNVLTFHYDLASTGLNANENQLTPANVKVGSFGKLFATPLDGAVYAEPLVDTNVLITNGPNTVSGAAGRHDVVFVATEHDSLYAIDAAVTGGSVLWKRSFLDTSVAENNTLGAKTITPVSNSDTSSQDITPEIGITGTPVIDPTTNILYLVATTKESINGATHFVQRLHAINILNGTDVTAPYLIGDTSGGNTNHTDIYVYGTGDGSVTDPYNGTGRKVVQFNALRHNQRAALSLVNHTIYAEWGAHADQRPYHGWVAAWDVSNVTTSGLKLKGVLNVDPNGAGAGVWQGGGRLAFEPDGNTFYFETGNGFGGNSNSVLDANGFPINANYYEALVKAVVDPASTPTSQNSNGWGIKIVDYFTPYNQIDLDNHDRDFGSGAPLLLPDSAGIPGHPHLMLASGKEGKIYVVDRDNLGKFDPKNDHVLNSVPNGSGNKTPPVQLGASLSTPAYFNNTIYWSSGYSSYAYAYKLNPDGTLSVKSQNNSTLGYLPGSPIVSANGVVGGIVWVMDRNANRIHAYDANSLNTELWNSGQKAGGTDNLGAVVKFAVPTVANGEVFVGTSNSLVVYGLTPPANGLPRAPVLAGNVVSSTSVNLTWSDPTTGPSIATSYAIEYSNDGKTFTSLTTAPGGANALAVGGLTPLTNYYFRIRGLNGIGNSPYSNVVNIATTNQFSGVDFSHGFASSASILSVNGAKIVGSKLELTSGAKNQSTSAFTKNLVDVTRFSTQFAFQSAAGA